MRAARDDPAAVEHHDLVAVEHGGQPVRDDQQRPVRGRRGQGVAQQLLVAGVEAGRRLVEQEQRRAGQQRPGDRQPLPLAAGEQHALVADQDVEAAG